MNWFRKGRAAESVQEDTSDHSRLLRAFAAHESLARPQIEALGVPVDSYIAGERWKNFQKDAAEYPALAEIVSVAISHTSDTEQPVISLTDVDGRRVSFWCEGERVTGITSY